MIEQAPGDVRNLHQAIGFDEESMACVKEYQPAGKKPRDLQLLMKDGKHTFATGDLPFMEVVDKYQDAQLPFKYLLKQINGTHSKGLDV